MTNDELIELIDELRALPKETEWVEFKSGAATTNQRFGQYISALSNAACINHELFGYLIFGIDDPTHKVVGTSFKFKTKKEGNEELEFWIRRLLTPSINFQHFVCQYNNLHVEIFRVPASRSEPTNFEKIPRIRIGTNMTDLRNYPNYIRAIYNSREDWSAKIIEKASIDDLDTTAIAQAREKFNLQRIRNVKYKFFPDNKLYSVDVNKYNTEVILEALNNCIAHQDYSRNARILLTEQTNKLIFENEGGFVDGTPDDYALGTKTPKIYRNKWLIDAMVRLGMIDSMGYGINKMCRKQIERYFPLPDYRQSTRENVVLEIHGHYIDENYSKLLIEKKDDLTLAEVILLDKIQKREYVTDEAIKLLKKKDLIEGRRGRYYISAEMAALTDQKTDYTHNKGLNNKFYKELILQHIKNHNYATRVEIDKLLWEKLPDSMNEKQKKIRINNILIEMSGTTIQNTGSRTRSKWILLNEKSQKAFNSIEAKK